MSRIENLLRSLTPRGVELAPLGELVRIRNGRDFKHLGHGEVPVYGTGGVMTHVDSAAFAKPSVLIPRKGSLDKLYYVDTPFWTVDTIFYTEIGDRLVPKFFYYYLRTLHLERLNKAGGVPSLTQTELNALRIPVPPLEVQAEIVRILDYFTEVEAELEAELEARAQQYAFYRDKLLTFQEPTVRRVQMGEVGTFFGGLTGKSKADFSGGNARFVSYVNVFNNIAVDLERDDFVRVEPGERQRSLMRGDIIFTGSSETPDEVGMSSVVTRSVPEPTYLNSFSVGYRLNDSELLDPEFAKHLFRSTGLRQQIIKTASGVTRFNVSKARLAKVTIPLPDRHEQSRIAAILDNFETLLNSLSVGLPAELAARRKQYEYYRDKLLTFEEAVA